MLKLFLSSLLIMFSFLMFFLNHPLSMGLMILFQTLLTCILSGMLIKTYWFSYILFLTFLGGLLVLFIYVSSIASNELFNLSSKMILFFLIFLLFSICFSIFFFNLKWMNLSFNMDMLNFFNSFLFFNNENKINLSKLYNNQTFLTMMMLIIYLFITLVAVVKITNIFFGPLRPSSM
uniref:NADH-ubiquinone oxidoreductase chain 6 n=1 Tax=Promalactis suzukiella TaxID=1511820 RepID=A0A0U1YZ03_9NEOP|nr:NADH dehydrogenase subunit 6 [Promalactis suzukiella]AJO68674.1 NADH dehydrogenase subunit 6 [Promalactis suzukiella]